MALTVGQLIELLKSFPPEMPAAIVHETVSLVVGVTELYSPTEEGPGPITAVGIRAVGS